MKLAIMQPCYLPWRGYFALMKLADVFIYLDDVPFPQGRSFQSRVAIKFAQGRCWLTVPVMRSAGQLIRDVRILENGWRAKHLKTLKQELPHAAALVCDLLEQPAANLCELNITLAQRIALHLGIAPEAHRSSAHSVQDFGWRKILALCRRCGADHYITAHGARNYFDHDAFEQAGIRVSYLDYDLTPYPQPYGAFDPYVTALDLINHAPAPASLVNAALVPWREFIARHSAAHQVEASV